ncbi:hypothetical protein Afil01_58760 [Actinorhabdospora filicis]|uniref:Uncharacterized protein n=1 Tax=Actinorhabdospora filicis TaxID=1785913 RepID=A0A9W6SSC0_9ACTN|nr:hypothetical protein [Actinorhabdospora filicis]GLZ81069.1 hypothetical protein Afil01_58760 [Actinorhabdospora filicis]
MGVGRHRLARIVDGLGHLAEVAVTAEPAAQNAVTPGPDPYGWRREVYGPSARVTGPDEDRMLAEALEGAALALAALSGGGRFHVTVVEVLDTPADTCPGDVRVAAAHATAEAVGGELGDVWFTRPGA